MDIKRFKEVKIKMIMKLRGISREEAARIEESDSDDVESDEEKRCPNDTKQEKVPAAEDFDQLIADWLS